MRIRMCISMHGTSSAAVTLAGLIRAARMRRAAATAKLRPTNQLCRKEQSSVLEYGITLMVYALNKMHHCIM